MSASMLMSISHELATMPGADSNDESSYHVAAVVAACRKAQSPVGFPKFDAIIPPFGSYHMRLRRGSDHGHSTTSLDIFNINDRAGTTAYYSELTRVDTMQRLPEPEAGAKLMDLLSLPEDCSLSYGPSKVDEANQQIPSKKRSATKKEKNTAQLTEKEKAPEHNVLSNGFDYNEFHDPSTQEPWRPLPVFDDRLTKAHATHLQEWQTKQADRDLNEARYEPYRVHHGPCQHIDCKCRHATGFRSDEISKALERYKSSRERQPFFYAKLVEAHTSANGTEYTLKRLRSKKAREENSELDAGVEDMHGIFRAYDAPDAPVGIFSKAEQDLRIDQMRRQLRQDEIQRGTSVIKLDAMEMEVLGKTQQQLRYQRAKAEDALFAQHRLFPTGRKHATLKFYPERRPSAPSGSEMSPTMLKISPGAEFAVGDALAADIEMSIAATTLAWLLKEELEISSAAETQIMMMESCSENTAAAAGQHLTKYGASAPVELSPSISTIKPNPRSADKAKISCKKDLEELLAGTLADIPNMSNKPMTLRRTVIDHATETVAAWWSFRKTQLKHEKKTVSPSDSISTTASVAGSAVQSPESPRRSTRSGRGSRPRKMYGDDAEAGSSGTSSTASSGKSVALASCLAAEVVEASKKRSGFVLKLKRSRTESEDEADSVSVDSGISLAPKRLRLVLKNSGCKHEER